MPNASLIALTSPLLLAQAPEAALAPVASPVPTIEAIAMADPDAVTRVGTAGMLNLQWTLAAAQPADTPPSEEGPGDEPADDEDQESDQQGGQQGEGSQIVVEGSYGPPENDPVQEINAESYRITQELDDALVEPVAYAYRDGLPGSLRNGLGNVVNNLREPNNALNFLLQGKIGKTFETIGRFMINSTLGLGGLVDIAEKPGINLPFRRNGFANTLGVYGVGSGPYLYLPLTGATTVRDFSGSFLDQLLLPVAVGKPFDRPEFTVPFYLVSNLEDRLEVDAELDRIEDTIDPYAARRDSYLYRRAREIAELKGDEPPERPLIMDEVEGTGDFADPPEDAPEDMNAPDGTASAEIEKPIVALVITKPR
ncbi:MAG: VacJ family lipoprotein [Pseudomonadota bacterium]